jgi:polyisoprenoid-binding protein YceI
VFRDFDVRVELDPDKPAKARIEVRIAVESVDMNSASFDRAIRGPAWFHPARFRQAQFRATAVRRVDGDSFFSRAGRCA